MDPDQQLRNLRDFLMVYNRMTEICFQRCTSNFNYRNLTMDEEHCVDSCAGKLIRTNHRLMGTYVQLMPRMMQRRMEEMESKAAENAKAAEAAAAASVAPPAAEASPESQTLITSSPPPQTPPLLDQPFTSMIDVGPEAHSSVLKPAELNIPAELNAAVSKPTTEVKLSAATPLTPATETVNLSQLNEAGNGPSYSGSFSLPPISGAKIESEISAPVFMPSKPMSLSGDTPVSTVAAPKPTESLSGQEIAPGVPPPSGQ
ncbi:mitochondrial import inner membrane translocase subunit Tim10 B [Plectropomus leopardus]|uniref:mitochondrial import inner membrane translocase subunit Tim10 B n=1 Tax=Plectropomus leopardus TaxID=160734 RepID=UPI001C4CB934|nr:mitochondrial import inner membrane translocase subunit Tim10 B [Plectropomus leopardus]